jgi:Tfp pilus assembly protein PilN
MLWLTDMEQKGETLTIQGRANTLPAVSDFVANLGESPILAKPLDLADTQVETLQAAPGQPGVELYKFTVKASIDSAAAKTTDAAKPVAAPEGGGGAGTSAR